MAETPDNTQEQGQALALQLFQNAQLISRAMLAGRLGMQFDGQRDLYKTFGYIQAPGYQDFRNLYDRQGMASRLVEKFANDTWNKPPVLVDGDARSDQPDRLTPFLKDWIALVKRLRVYKFLRQADIMLGFSRYSIIFFGAPGESFGEEVGTKGALFYLNAFDELQATISDYITDTKDPKFGMPSTYNVNFNIDEGVPMPGGGAVHHSRILHITEDSLGSRIYGRPRLQTVINRLFDLEKVTGGGAEAAWLAVYKGVLISAREGAELPARDSAEGRYMDEQISAFFNKMQRYAVLTDAEIHDMGVDQVSIKDMYDTLMTDIAATKGIPQRILTGSERGELASNQDTAEWNTVIASRRTNFAEPDMLRPFIQWCVVHKVISAPKGGEFGVEWQPVYPMSQKEEAEYGNLIATGASTVTGGVPEEALDVNEWRNIIHLAPRTPQQMDDARERSDGPRDDDDNPNEADQGLKKTGQPKKENLPVASTQQSGDESIADKGMNGAQNTSLVEIIAQVTAKQMSSDAAIQLIRTAFPNLDIRDIENMVNSAAAFTPKDLTTNEEQRSVFQRAIDFIQRKPDPSQISVHVDNHPGKPPSVQVTNEIKPPDTQPPTINLHVEPTPIQNHIEAPAAPNVIVQVEPTPINNNVTVPPAQVEVKNEITNEVKLPRVTETDVIERDAKGRAQKVQKTYKQSDE